MTNHNRPDIYLASYPDPLQVKSPVCSARVLPRVMFAVFNMVHITHGRTCVHYDLGLIPNRSGYRLVFTVSVPIALFVLIL